MFMKIYAEIGNKASRSTQNLRYCHWF